MDINFKNDIIGNGVISQNLEPNTITFNFNTNINKEPILGLKENGDILVRGKLVANDKEVVDALREFVTSKKDI